MQAKGSTCEIRTKKKAHSVTLRQPTSKRISAVSSGLLIIFHILISKQSSKPSDRLVRHSSADLCLALYPTGANHATPKMSIKKSLNGFNHQILVFENLFSCSGFRGLCPPRRFSKTHSRKSWAITRVYNLSDNNELVRFVQFSYERVHYTTNFTRSIR